MGFASTPQYCRGPVLDLVSSCPLLWWCHLLLSSPLIDCLLLSTLLQATPLPWPLPPVRCPPGSKHPKCTCPNPEHSLHPSPSSPPLLQLITYSCCSDGQWNLGFNLDNSPFQVVPAGRLVDSAFRACTAPLCVCPLPLWVHCLPSACPPCCGPFPVTVSSQVARVASQSRVRPAHSAQNLPEASHACKADILRPRIATVSALLWPLAVCLACPSAWHLSLRYPHAFLLP